MTNKFDKMYVGEKLPHTSDGGLSEEKRLLKRLVSSFD